MDQELQQKAELLAASRRTLLVDAACAERTLHYTCALTRWQQQHFSARNDVMATILKV